MQVDPRRLRVLLAVARTGGVLAAADELQITASAASQQLQKLEEQVGHALVVRTRKGSTLTPSGLALAEAAEEIERVLNVALARVQGRAALAGKVGLGGFTSFLRTMVIPQLPLWRARHPQLQIEIIEDDDLPALMRRLRGREIDAVVIESDFLAHESDRLPPGVREEPLLDDPWQLVVPSGSLVPSDNVDLSRLTLPWLTVQAGSASAAAVTRISRVSGAKETGRHQYMDTLTALALVAAGEGVTVLPALALHGIVQPGVDVVNVPGLGTRRIVLRRFDPGPKIDTPMDTVADLLRESVANFDRRSDQPSGARADSTP